MKDQNTRLLEQKIAAYYETKSLPDDRLDRILREHTQTDANNQNISISKRKLFSFTGAAALLFFTLLTAQFFILQSDVKQLVFAEIAMNHNKNLQPEFFTSNYNDLANSMQRLDFELSAPDIIQAKYDVLGGRYCSIQGNIAAQLKIKDKQTGEVATLYITRLQPDLKKIAPDTTTVDEARIELWHSENKFYGLAVNAD